MRLPLIFGLILLFTFNLFGQTEQKTAPVEIKFGSVALDAPTEMIKRLTPMTNYLNKKTGYNISLQVSPNMTAAIDALGRNNTQIAYLTPAAYVEAHEKYGVVPLVSFLQHGKGYFKLVIAVKKDSPFKSVKDLKGKKFAFGDKKAKLQPAIVIKSGLKLEDFATYDYLNHYDNVAKAILNGDFDAGILVESIANNYKAQGLRIIHTSIPLPPHLIAVNSKIDPKISLKLKNALLALNAKDPADKEIIAAFEIAYDGFQKASNKDYDPVRSLTRDVK